MPRSLLFGLSILLSGISIGQPYGNEWINYDRQYWRFDIAVEGIYRLDHNTLQNAGFPVSTVDPREIQLFAFEQEVPIHVTGEDDGSFDPGDVIEFYARGNDGWLDVGMWDQPELQNNPYFSLYNDTIRYFLTWAATWNPQRIEDHVDSSFTAPVRPFGWAESLLSLANRYQIGDRDPIGASGCTLGSGEGWFYTAELVATTVDVDQTILSYNRWPYQQPGAPDATITFVTAGTNNPGNFSYDDHHLQAYYGTAPGVLVADTIFRGYQLNRFQFDFPAASLGFVTTPLRLRAVHDLNIPGQPNYPDRQALAYIHNRYPRTWYMNNVDRHMFWLDDEPNDAPAHIDFNAFVGSPVIYVFGPTVRRVVATPVPGLRWKAMIPADPSADQTKAYMFGLGSIDTIAVLTPVGTGGFFTDHGPLEVDSGVVMVSHGSLMNAAMQYASYRETSPRNPRQTLLVDVDELYDQYGGGIPKHAFAIRRFMDRLLDTWSTDPSGLLLVGKSVQTPKVGTVGGSRLLADSIGYKRCLVPTYGYPPSDVQFTLGLDPDPRRLPVPVGRISANNEQQVLDYLAKVQSFEGFTQPERWMKNILHFRGGFNESEWAQFNAYLSGFKVIAEDTCFGGNVITFVKNSSDIYQQAPADSVRNLIENGITLMTFFAHAAGGGFDINIDTPGNYDWNGKYPMFIGNSCYSGNIHLQTTASASEKFVVIPNAGSIAFLASVDIGITSELGPYTTHFYKSFSQVNYGGTIGQHMQHAVFEELNSGFDIRTVNNVQTFTLEGDPLLILNSWPEPDYEITTEGVTFDPYPVTASVDTFALKVQVTNIGKATNDAPAVRVTRTLQDGTARPPLSADLAGLRFQDSVVFRMPVMANTGGKGVNQFDVTVDLDPDEVPEMEDLMNNRVLTSTLITSGDIQPVYPYEYAIIPQSAPTLRASTGNPFLPAQNYVFQIDTTDTFDSPVMESAMVNAPGGVVEWDPPGIFQLNSMEDSLVYFWRCSPDSASNGGFNWYETSFQYIAGKDGWGQAHYYQFKKDKFDQVVYDRPERDFDFYSGTRSVRCRVQGSSSGAGNDDTQWYLDLVWQDGNGCGSTPAFHVAVVDPTDFTAWGTHFGASNPDNFFGNFNENGACRQRVEYYFIFRQNNQAQLDGMLNMLQNAIPDGHFVLIYTWKYLNRFSVEGLNPGLLDQIELMGGDSIRQINDSLPYICFFKKGDPSTAVEEWGATPTSLIELEVYVNSLGNTGRMSTPLAGPALEWKGLYWNEVPLSPQDSARIQLYGITLGGSEQLLYDLASPIDSLTPFTTPAFNVDAELYPWLRIAGVFNSDSSLTPKPAQMERWQLLNGPAPECALDPPSGYYEQLVDIYEGRPARVAVAIRNISTVPMDSVLLTAWVIDRNNVRHPVKYGRLAPLPVGGVLMDTLTINTNGLAGTNTLVIEANGIDSLTLFYDQPEQYHFNNIAQISFDILEDLENPLLDVTFDGLHILNGDIVSARPEIQITLDDENPILLLDSPADTVYFKVFLNRPNGVVERIYFRDGNGMEVLQFLPADGPENISSIFYRPHFEQDGKYSLIVQARDVSANESGDNDYRVDFEVINRATITEVLNYPNPFTTSTRFVFTVTGQEPPTYMKVQIMTITGRVVREVHTHELGPLRVGRNITEFAWDGTDQFGDKLARGIYLYRVFAKLHGEDIEIRSTNAGGYFEKGYGKMYLLR